MNRRRILGAIAFPTFMLAWAAAAMLLLLQLQPAAALEHRVPAWEPAAAAWWREAGRELAPVPSLDDPRALRSAVDEMARYSEVMNGSWQPRREAPPAGDRTAIVVAVETQTSAPSSEPTVTVRAGATEVVAAAAPVAAGMPPASGDTEPAAAGRAGGAAPASVRKRATVLPRPRLVVEKAEARLALQAGRYAEAYGRLRPSVADARGDSEYLGLLALAAMRTGNNAEALVVYQHLVGLEPETPRWHVGFALAQESLGLDASGVYRDALALSDAGTEVRALLQEKLGEGGPTGFS
ncbi:MAG: BTAD domain-containing putative transcriptional regulator [Pseudomonadales bacterium]